MKLRHLRVQRFRGIKQLDWFLNGDFLCLVGPGDSCKSTILDAIELVLSPRWNPVFDDSDFYQGDPSEPLVVEATVGALPRRLLSDERFGLKLRGYDAVKIAIHDEPEDGDEEVVTVRLSVDSSLEPKWTVVADRHPEGVPIGAKERERFGVMRLGTLLDRHLSWSKGSALATLSGEQDDHAQLLADAGRHARGTVDPSKLPKMNSTAGEVAALARKLGVSPRSQFEPRIDPAGMSGAGGLALHDGMVPARRAGMGTRRLLTLSIQRQLTKEGGVVLIDEIEHGLEPFRLRRLLTELLPSSTAVGAHAGSANPGPPGVVVLTTHSAVTVGQLRAEHLRIVRNDDQGNVRVLQPTPAIQGTLITHAEAFLSRRIVVCEGPTEMGVLLGLDSAWSATRAPFAVAGVGLANGGGVSKLADVARSFRQLGYDTLVFADSDEPMTETPEALAAAGVVPVLWDGGICTEQRLFLDLPWAAVGELVQLALDEGLAVREHVASALGRGVALAEDPNTWCDIVPEPELRPALGRAAKGRNSAWFKNVRLGTKLGEVVAANVSQVPGTDLALKIEQIRAWVFGDA